MTLCAITGNLKDTTGTAIVGAVLTFRPFPSLIQPKDGAMMTPEPKSITTGSGGSVSVSLADGPYLLSILTSDGERIREIAVPAASTADIAAILSTPSVAYEVMTWPAFQSLVAATAAPYGTVAAGISGVADGATFIAAQDDTLVVARRSGSAAVFLYPELL